MAFALSIARNFSMGSVEWPMVKIVRVLLPREDYDKVTILGEPDDSMGFTP